MIGKLEGKIIEDSFEDASFVLGSDSSRISVNPRTLGGELNDILNKDELREDKLISALENLGNKLDEKQKDDDYLDLVVQALDDD